MNRQVGPVWRLAVKVPQSAADLMEKALGGPDVATSLFSLAGGLEKIEPVWLVEAFWPTKPDRAEISSRLLAAAAAVGLNVAPDLQIEELQTRDWVAESEASHKPVVAGRFFIHGPHDASIIPDDKTAIEIPAAQAFGTGSHETTRGCLMAIQEIMDARAEANPLSSVLDMGTGSGILAIALARAYGQAVLASDIDPQATEWAVKNAENNGVASSLTAVTATGFDHDEITRRAPYDLILANILAKPLVALAGEMSTHLKPGGRAILAGMLCSQADDVLSAYQDAGLHLFARKQYGDWSIMVVNI